MGFWKWLVSCFKFSSSSKAEGARPTKEADLASGSLLFNTSSAELQEAESTPRDQEQEASINLNTSAVVNKTPPEPAVRLGTLIDLSRGSSDTAQGLKDQLQPLPGATPSSAKAAYTPLQRYRVESGQTCGIDNTVMKYQEKNSVQLHLTPFEKRVEVELEKEAAVVRRYGHTSPAFPKDIP